MGETAHHPAGPRGTRALLACIDHRPQPPPRRAFWGHQTWRHLLFAHWPVAAKTVQALLPEGLEVDVFPGDPDVAWIGIVPFEMAGVRPRGLPALPGLSRFCELNVRTYVRHQSTAGVYFFSLDASGAVGVWLAQRAFHLPYYRARMRLQVDAGGQCSLTSQRAGIPEACFAATYAPAGPSPTATPQSLEHWLTNRYVVFSDFATTGLWRADIHHRPWSLQPATARFDSLGVAAAAKVSVGGEPALLHYVADMQVLIWGPQRLV